MFKAHCFLIFSIFISIILSRPAYVYGESYVGYLTYNAPVSQSVRSSSNHTYNHKSSSSFKTPKLSTWESICNWFTGGSYAAAARDMVRNQIAAYGYIENKFTSDHMSANGIVQDFAFRNIYPCQSIAEYILYNETGGHTGQKMVLTRAPTQQEPFRVLIKIEPTPYFGTCIDSHDILQPVVARPSHAPALAEVQQSTPAVPCEIAAQIQVIQEIIADPGALEMMVHDLTELTNAPSLTEYKATEKLPLLEPAAEYRAASVITVDQDAQCKQLMSLIIQYAREVPAAARSVSYFVGGVAEGTVREAVHYITHVDEFVRDTAVALALNAVPGTRTSVAVKAFIIARKAAEYQQFFKEIADALKKMSAWEKGNAVGRMVFDVVLQRQMLRNSYGKLIAYRQVAPLRLHPFIDAVITKIKQALIRTQHLAQELWQYCKSYWHNDPQYLVTTMAKSHPIRSVTNARNALPSALKVPLITTQKTTSNIPNPYTCNDSYYNKLTRKRHTHTLKVDKAVIGYDQVEKLRKAYDHTRRLTAEMGGHSVTLAYEHFLGPHVQCFRGKEIIQSGGHHDYNLVMIKSGDYKWTLVRGEIALDKCYELQWTHHIIDEMKPSTFFPYNWSRCKVVEKILESLDYIVEKEFKNGNKWIVVGFLEKENMYIEMVIKEGKIITAYPTFKAYPTILNKRINNEIYAHH